MKAVGLFAGVGGFEEGLRRAGHKTILTCESWKPAQAVLAARMRGAPNHPDIRELKDLPEEIELLVGGFPCQDLSQAGQTAGIDGLRSSLVGEVFRLLDKRAVPWVVLENVSFMLHLDRGRAMEMVVSAFEERDYRWAYRVINSLGFLPQRRERVFFVASTIRPLSAESRFRAGCVQLIEGHRGDKPHGQGGPIMPGRKRPMPFGVCRARGEGTAPCARSLWPLSVSRSPAGSVSA